MMIINDRIFFNHLTIRLSTGQNYVAFCYRVRNKLNPAPLLEGGKSYRSVFSPVVDVFFYNSSTEDRCPGEEHRSESEHTRRSAAFVEE